MGTAKRERQKQGRQARIDAARVAQQRAGRLRTIRNFAIVIVLLVVAIFIAARLTGGSKNSDNSVVAASGSDASASGSTTTTLPAGTVAIDPPAPGATITGDTTCPPADGSATRTTTFAKPPPMCIDPAKTYTATITTNKGAFTILLDAKAAPNTVNNFVVLARYHYFDGVPFHRIIPNFVIQGGDAVGPTLGSGGPGYEFNDELPAGSPAYAIGDVAMANSGPNTNGSQFFVITGSQGASLPAQYSKFGKVTSGMDIVNTIAALATQNPGGGAPTTTDLVTMQSVTIAES